MNDNRPLTKDSLLSVSGKVEKVVKREGQCKLVIQTTAPGWVVFADCLGIAEDIALHGIKKGSSVGMRGKVASFGSSAVCLAECELL